MFVRGTYDATGRASELTTNKSVVPGAGAEFTIACTNGAVAKCARQWGYKPWKSAPNQRNGGEHDLRPYHQMCLRAARADYCADGRSFTVDGTLIDMADSRGFVQRESEQSTSYSFAGESVFTTNIGSGSPEGRAWCLMRSRFEENASAITCATKPIYNLNSCFPYYGDTYFTNDPSNGVYDMVWAGTKSYCSHKTSEVGGRLAADCNQCTRRVCDAASEGSASSLGGTQWASSSPTAGDSYCCSTSWDSLCVSEAAAWCTPSEWSNRNEFGAWKAGEPPALEADWYALKGPNGEIRWDFPGIVKDYGPLGTAPFGTPAGFPANSGARWVGHNVTTQESDYFRYRFRGWKTGTVNVYVAAYDEFKVYVDGVFLGGGAAPGVASVYSAPTVDGKEHLVAVSTKKAGGGGVFALDIR
jgi:ADYC domain